MAAWPWTRKRTVWLAACAVLCAGVIAAGFFGVRWLHQRALIAQLNDPNANPHLRHQLFVKLARTGGRAGLRAVLAAKDRSRTLPPLTKTRDLERLGLAATGKDSDHDSLTDLMERRLGTDPHNPDTDGDGLKDGVDKNPLAAPRRLSEVEQILAAAFEARPAQAPWHRSSDSGGAGSPDRAGSR